MIVYHATQSCEHNSFVFPWILIFVILKVIIEIDIGKSNTISCLLGHFYASDIKDESVLAMCSNHPEDSVLITGDTQGYITVWEILDYCLEPLDTVNI